MHSMDLALFGLRVLFTIFAPFEVYGAVTGHYFGGGPERDRTLSQVLQLVARQGRAWLWAMRGFSVTLTLGAAIAWWPVHPAIGTALGLTVLVFMLLHLNRERNG